MSMSKSPEPVSVISLGKGVFESIFKDLNMRLSWVIQVGSESGDKCPVRDRIGKDKQKSGRQCAHRGRHWHDAAKEGQ